LTAPTRPCLQLRPGCRLFRWDRIRPAARQKNIGTTLLRRPQPLWPQPPEALPGAFPLLEPLLAFSLVPGPAWSLRLLKAWSEAVQISQPSRRAAPRRTPRKRRVNVAISKD